MLIKILHGEKMWTRMRVKRLDFKKFCEQKW